MNSIFDISPAAFAPFYDTPVAFHGTRPNARPLAFAVQCMVQEDSPDFTIDDAAPSFSRIFNLTFPATSWLDVTPPHLGDGVLFDWRGERIAATVCKVPSRLPDGDFCLMVGYNQKEATR